MTQILQKEATPKQSRTIEQHRLELHEYLCDILGSRNCYYSPPASMKMKYPCIVYNLSGVNTKHADNIPYLTALEWDITVIDEDPDSEIASRMLQLPKCRFDRPLNSSDGLNHFYYTLYY